MGIPKDPAAGRAASAVSREVARGGAAGRHSYDAARAERAARARKRRGPRKLAAGTELLAHVVGQLRGGWSPQQIAGRLQRMHPEDPQACVSHEKLAAEVVSLL